MEFQNGNVNEIYYCGSGSNGILFQEKDFDILDFQKICIKELGIGKNITKMVLTAFNAFILLENGEIMTWGEIKKNKKIHIPISLEFKVAIKDIVCGFSHSLFISSDEELWGIGENSFGELGIPNMKKIMEPTLIKLPFPVLKCFVGFRQTFLILKKSEDYSLVYCAGNNRSCQLAIFDQEVVKEGFILNSNLNELNGISKISGGQKHSCFLSSKGLLYGCGDSSKFGQLGEYSKINFLKLIDDKVEDIESGWNHIIYKKSGILYSLGRNDYGQLGINTSESSISKPTKIDLICDKFVTSTEHSLATSDGSVYTWGWNEHGNCGSGDKHNLLKPKLVLTTNSKVSLLVNGAFSFVLKT